MIMMHGTHAATPLTAAMEATLTVTWRCSCWTLWPPGASTASWWTAAWQGGLTANSIGWSSRELAKLAGDRADKGSEGGGATALTLRDRWLSLAEAASTCGCEHKGV